MSKYQNIRVLVARSQQAVFDGQCDDVRQCDTIAEAKKFARSADRRGEQREDVCVADYFRKGYCEPSRHHSAGFGEADDSDMVSPAFQEDTRDPMKLGGI